MADPPIQPLPSPAFSFDASSPKVADGQVHADALLGLNNEALQVMREGWEFGLGLADDEIDGLSLANSDHVPSARFSLLFSVDRSSPGLVAPDAELVALGIPYNIQDQAARGHAGGDQFLSTALYSLTLPVESDTWNSVLVRNNFDEGGTDFVADPPVSAYEVVVGAPQDDVDATVVAGEGDELYFTVSRASPSLAGLQGRPFPSGADVFRFLPPGRRLDRSSSTKPSDPPQPVNGACQAGCVQQANGYYGDCRSQGGSVEGCAAGAHALLDDCLQTTCAITPPAPPGLYATAVELGLVPDDDVDALIVFDTNGNGLFDGDDTVLFSLTADSPSLTSIPGASISAGAADVFVVQFGDPGPALFAAATELGLGDSQDNIDALDYLICDDSAVCALTHGIRANDAIPAASQWGLLIMALGLMTMGAVIARSTRYA